MSTVYIDTSALLKRVVSEPQSVAVIDALRAHVDRGDLVTSSSLAWVELARALRRARTVTPHLDPELALAHAVSGVAELPLDDAVLIAARRVGHLLRTLDALHLASALVIGADTVMTFDSRLATAVAEEGLGVSTPA